MTISQARVNQSYVDWIHNERLVVFGTLNFTPGRKPHIAEAEVLWRQYWRKVNRAAYGQSPRFRMERVIFRHTGALGDNPHIHFLTASPIDVPTFCILLSAIWTGSSPRAAPPIMNEILPVFNDKNARVYLLNELGLDADTFCGELSHLPGADAAAWVPAQPHSKAQERLEALARIDLQQEARTAFDHHSIIVPARHQKNQKWR